MKYYNSSYWVNLTGHLGSNKITHSEFDSNKAKSYTNPHSYSIHLKIPHIIKKRSASHMITYA